MIHKSIHLQIHKIMIASKMISANKQNKKNT